MFFEGVVGSCDVVGVQDRLRDGGGATLRALACIILSDGPGVGTLNSGVVGNPGCSTLGDGVSVASGFVVPWWRVERRILLGF
jgi:hypothetical protein